MINFPKIVIIGGGFGGIALAKALKDKEVDVLLLDKHNYHTFQPLLYQVASGGLEPDSIAFPLRKIFKDQHNFTFRIADVQHISPDYKKVETSIGDFPYDYLIIATGSTTNFFGNDEIEHHAMPMKTIPEALNLRSSILQNFELALLAHKAEDKEALMNFVIVGGGPTGVETAGALAELKNSVLPKDYPELNINKMKITIIESSKLLAGMSEAASNGAEKFLKKLGVDIIINDRLTDYNGQIATLKSGNTINTRNVIWTAGVRGATIEGIAYPTSGRGNRIEVNHYNRIKGYTDIFAIGDVACMRTEAYPEGHPGVAPVAIQQATLLATNILNIINKIEPQSFEYFNKGSMATVGRNKAVVDLPFISFQGVFAWLTWMFVHLLTLVGFRNKMIVFINWIWNYFSYDRGTRLIIRPYVKKPEIVIQNNAEE